jgi:phosphoglycolate phosphatase-like HAD superfamily hydrolase
MMFPEIRAVLFDLDGTLVDSAPDLGAAADKLRTDRGLAALGVERYRAMAGAGARGMLGVAFGLTPDDADFASLREEFFSNYERRLTEQTSLFEGVQVLIGALQTRGLPWGVVTNKAERFSIPLTQHMPLFASSPTYIQASGSTPRRRAAS